MNILFQRRFPNIGLIIAIFILFIIFEGLSFSYIRHHSNNAGFNHHTQVHTMYYYNHALGNTDAINISLMYIHWPLLKIEGLLTNSNISMLHRYQYIEVHRLQKNPKDNTYSTNL